MDIVFNIVLLLAAISGSVADITCPDVFVQKGSTHAISCDIGSSVVDFYWYRGQSSRSSPILTLESGQKGGSEYGKNHFDIADNGSMIIRDVTLEHESYYTFVAFDENRTYNDATFMVNVTIAPNPLCPVIAGCSPCTSCSIPHPFQSGTLRCTVSRARPLITLKWNITSQTGISFVQDQPVEQQNEASKSWDTSVSADYQLTDTCGAHAVIYCMAHDDANILSSPIAALEISNEPCSDVTPNENGFPILLVVLIILGSIVVIVICIVITCLLKYSHGETATGESFLPLLPSKGTKINRKSLVDALATFYEKYCALKPLPWGEPIPIAALYSEFQCEVTLMESSMSGLQNQDPLEQITSSVDLFASSRFKDSSRVFFIADLGYGKTTMTQQVVHRWMKKEKTNFILIYIQLKDVDINKSIVAVVKDMLPDSMNATLEDIENVLKENKLLVLMDGLDELSMSLEEDLSDQVEKEGDSEMVELKNGEEKQHHVEYASSKAPVGDLVGSLKEDTSDKVEDTSDKVEDTSDKVEDRSDKVEDTSDKVEDTGDFLMVQIDNGEEEEKPHHVECASSKTTVGDLLKGNVRSKDFKIRVWVTSREVDDMKSPFPPPYVKIKMTGFSKSQVDDYIRKTCQYYCQLSVYKRNTEDKEGLFEDAVDEVRKSLEKDDIIKEFSKTPLLLVLIIHILSANVTGTVNYLKDLKLTKLTTLVRTVITCLESRYVQKIEDESIQSKIEEIERKLGEVAWKEKLQVTHYNRDGWDKLLGIDNVELALSIGLLRMSKNVSNINVHLRQLAFTSFTGVEFYHQYFQEYLAGQYFPSHQKALRDLEQLLGDGKDDKTIRFLQFMSGCGHPLVRSVQEIFLENKKMWNNLIDFIYEAEDQETVKSCLKGMSKVKLTDLNWRQVERSKLNWNELGTKVFRVAPIVNFKYLNQKYHQDAVVSFCENCNLFDIKIRAFTFRNDCPLDYLTKLVLPQLERLELLERDISAEDFVSIVEWISRQRLPKVLQFTKCTLEELTKESKEAIKNVMKDKELNIYRKETNSKKGLTVDSFNTNKGVWRTKFFPEIQ